MLGFLLLLATFIALELSRTRKVVIESMASRAKYLQVFAAIVASVAVKMMQLQDGRFITPAATPAITESSLTQEDFFGFFRIAEIT
jgi:hypothetical protein